MIRPLPTSPGEDFYNALRAEVIAEPLDDPGLVRSVMVLWRELDPKMRRVYEKAAARFLSEES